LCRLFSSAPLRNLFPHRCWAADPPRPFANISPIALPPAGNAAYLAGLINQAAKPAAAYLSDMTSDSSYLCRPRVSERRRSPVSYAAAPNNMYL